MSNRKYENVKGYWIYSIKVPSIGKYYIGVSKTQCSQRWRKSGYVSKSLSPYLNEWEDMEKTVLVDGLTKEEALKYEDNIIRALSMNNLCINKQRSGLITNDINTYQKEYYQNNKERQKQHSKKWKENNKEKVKQYYEDNKEKEKQRIKQWQKDNREKLNEYQRQRRLKKKLEKTIF